MTPIRSIFPITVCFLVLLLLAASRSYIANAAPIVQTTNGTESYTISYASAAQWLENVPEEEREDQIRDYALLGLATLLNFDVTQLRNALYDRTPIRDSLFWDLAANQGGPGRALFDGENTLYLLVPIDDPYADRTVGLLLDEHRKNVGTDAEEIVLYRYSIDSSLQQVTLQAEAAQSTAALRESHGYVEMAVGTLLELEQFLAQTQHLSQLEVVDGALYAAGWNWPNIPTGNVTVEDITVLQRGYVDARGTPVTVAQFLTTDIASQIDIEFRIPRAAKEAAEELDTFFVAFDQADSEADYDALLVDFEDLILEVLLDNAVTERLERNRPTQSKTDWLYDLWEALLDEIETNELWGTLWYIATGDFLLPEPGVTEPGFSLDPGPPMSLIELLSLLPTDQYPELSGHHMEIVRFLEGWFADTDSDAFWNFMNYHETFIQDVILTDQEATEARELLDIILTHPSDEKAIQAAGVYLDMIDQALSDPDRPWPVLVNVLEGNTAYQYARYDGGLRGTEAGMTYFYTDILAKGFFYELGTGNPFGAVKGFLPKSQSVVPWGHCTTDDQKGRIWFGLREESVGILPDRIALGGLTTRVFVLMDDPEFGEQEIEPTYMFGQGVWWWDRHYLEMADYEPQYHRLDQLMRWGAAIAWLVDGGEYLLPTVSEGQITDDWHFADWLTAHSELKWHHEIPFVEVTDQNTETFLTLFSRPYDACGGSWVSSGGISNPSIWRIAEIAEQRPNLPAALSRGGLDSTATTFLPRHNSGTIATLDGIHRTLPEITEDSAKVQVVANGRKVWSLGGLKVAMLESTPRHLDVTISQNQEGMEWGMTVQNVDLGELAATRADNHIELLWEDGALAELRSMLEELQSLLLDNPLQDALELAEGIVSAEDDDGNYHVEIALLDGSSLFLIIGTEPNSGDEELSFRLAKPVIEDDILEEIEWYYATIVDESATVEE